MTALTTRSTQSLPMGDELKNMIDLCNTLAKAPFYVKIGPAGVLAICLTARELGLPLMSCLNGGLHTFDGKVTISSQMMNLMIINAGHFINVLHNGEDYCEIEFERSDRPGRNAKFIYRYTIQDAEKAGYLKKDNWIKQRKAMLFARCLSGGGRIWMPDVFLGVYVMGELNDDPKMEEAVVEHIHVHNEPQVVVYQQEKPKVEHVVFEPEALAYIDFLVDKTDWGKDRIVEWATNNSEQFTQKFEAWLQQKATIEHQPKAEEV